MCILILICRFVSLPNDPTDLCQTAQCKGRVHVYIHTLSCTMYISFVHVIIPGPSPCSTHPQPSIIPYHLHQLHCLLPQLDLATLLRLARLFDPSHNTIRPLLIKAHSNKKRCQKSHTSQAYIIFIVMNYGSECIFQRVLILLSYMYSWKFLLEENFRQFHQLLLLTKFLSTIVCPVLLITYRIW